ncbi:sodium channel subunit beta-1 [Chanos chanos]|uniref:Sodium channel regulatory subunit beta-3 n=1 Tax=Chanos chanos TaxID=29144 RepID=A0A6J2VYT2_CHACN|nr:sodium channel subunit beta-1-like [Chanos chanos]
MSSYFWLRSFWVLMMFMHNVSQCQAGCAEVDSMTEAVAGQSSMLGCISCKRRAEVPGSAIVEWHFKPLGSGEDFVHIFSYQYPDSTIHHEDFEERLEWYGTKGTSDVQIGAVLIHNVTFNDTGTYRCSFLRTLYLPVKEEFVNITKEVELTVVSEANRELTAVISEIMMFVLIVVLQLWMIGVLIYCYKKVYAENEAREARKAMRAEHEHLESKDPCDGVHME